MKHILIVGAGGVASYLIPCLIKAFRPDSILLMDADVLEERNLDRQLFGHEMIGMHKADGLRRMHDTPECPIFTRIEWLTNTTEVTQEIECVVCVADNHEARRNAIKLAYEKDVRCYIGGNEYFDAEAYVTWKEHEGTSLDPRVRYPLIATSTEGSPTSCQGEAQEVHPQLALANMRCAAHLLHLLFAWETVIGGASYNEAKLLSEHYPVEIQSSLTTQTCLTIPHIKAQKIRR